MSDPMTFWRLSWLGPDGWLYPPFGYNSNTEIRPRARAICVHDSTHRPPEPGCHCGFYGCDNIPALLPLAIGLRDLNPAAAAARCTPVLHGVELGTAVREEHAAYTPLGTFQLAALRMQGIRAVVEGRGTFRGSPATVTGPLHIPAHPGIANGAADQARRRYRIQVEHHDGDIADLIERLAGQTQTSERRAMARRIR